MADNGLGLAGIASGIDTAGIIDKLMAIERQSATRLKLRQTAVSAQQSGLRDVQAKVRALRDAADALKSAGTWGSTQAVTSSDPTRVSVERPTGVAPPSGYTVSVTSLAAGARQTFDTWTPPTAATTLKVGSDPEIQLNAGATVDDVVSALNGTTSSVWAASVGGKLVLSTRVTGQAATNPTVTVGGTALTPSSTAPGADAAYAVNGVAGTSASNVVTVDGVKLTFNAPTSTPVAISVGTPGPDKAGIKAKVQAFVDAYNGLVTSTRAKLDEKAVANATAATDAAKGQLFGDSGLTSLLSRLRTGLTDSVAGLANASLDSLAELGVSTGKATGAAATDDAKAGKLVIDDAKLDAALTANPQDVRALFAGTDSAPGLVDRLDALLGAQTQAGGLGNGLLDGRLRSADDQLKDLSSQMSTLNQRLDAKQATLKAQFAAMESALAAAQTQQQWLVGQLAQLR
jgi:flagellar hook-associated protein 2